MVQCALKKGWCMPYREISLNDSRLSSVVTVLSLRDTISIKTQTQMPHTKLSPQHQIAAERMKVAATSGP